MAIVRWIGGAPAVAMAKSYQLSGTFSSPTDAITFTYGNAQFTVVIGGLTIPNILTTLQAAYAGLSSQTFPQFTEQAMTNDGVSTFTLTANDPTKPFACTVSTNSASGLINGSNTSAGNLASLYSSPYDVSTAANYSTNALPNNGDTLIFDQPAKVKYFPSSVGSVNNLTVNVNPGFSATGGSQMGLPQTNADGAAYPEYRPYGFNFGCATLVVNTDCQLLRFDQGNLQYAATVLATGSSSENNVPAMTIKGASASNTLDIQSGSVGVAVFGNESGSQLFSITLSGGQLTCGVGVSSVGHSITMTGGGMLLQGTSCSAITVSGGTLAMLGSASMTTINVWSGGTLIYNASGNITTLNVGGSVTLSTDVSRTITTCNGYKGGSLSFDAHTTSFSSGIVLTGLKLSDFTISAGTSLSLTVTGL